MKKEVAVVDREIILEMNNQDLAENSLLLAKIHTEVQHRQQEFQEIAQAHKAAMRELNDRATDILTSITSRQQKKVVKCVEEKDYDAGVRRLLFNGQVIEEVPLTDQDRQQSLPEVEILPPSSTDETSISETPEAEDELSGLI